MPEQMEILLEEMAILRQEIAHLHAMLEQMGESFQSLNVAFLQHLDALATLVREIQSRLPPLPQ
jgi:hypothetical protein